MIVGAAIALSVLVMFAVLFLREADLPQAAPPSPFQHLDERKASIYENLRDLQFEYRVGKLSDSDYQQTKIDLQKELAKVLAEVDRLKTELQVTTTIVHEPSKGARKAAKMAPIANVASKKAPAAVGVTCTGCGAGILDGLKFCGECGTAAPSSKCGSCGAEFNRPLKFCGQCGAAMTAIRSRA